MIHSNLSPDLQEVLINNSPQKWIWISPPYTGETSAEGIVNDRNVEYHHLLPLSQVYCFFFPPKDEINLSMMWCLLVIFFAL